MFVCSACKTSTEPRQPVNLVITKVRNVTYETIIYRNSPRGESIVTEGTEIESEIKTCPKCYSSLTGLQPKIVEQRMPIQLKKKKVQKPWNDMKKKFLDDKRKADPHWKDRRDLDDVRKRESASHDPRPNQEKRKPTVEIVNRVRK